MKATILNVILVGMMGFVIITTNPLHGLLTKLLLMDTRPQEWKNASDCMIDDIKCVDECLDNFHKSRDFKENAKCRDRCQFWYGYQFSDCMRVGAVGLP